ncbi:MAG: hypothetical protein R2800_13720 [Flavipsychrobacter sp.]
MMHRIIVKHTCTCLFFLAFLMSATPLYQLFKTPILYTHYFEHKVNNPDISVFDYIFMHYIGDDGVSEDDVTDMQLPFKKVERNTLQDLYSLTFASIPTTKCITAVATSFCLYCHQRYRQFYDDAMLKPPQAT